MRTQHLPKGHIEGRAMGSEKLRWDEIHDKLSQAVRIVGEVLNTVEHNGTIGEHNGSGEAQKEHTVPVSNTSDHDPPTSEKIPNGHHPDGHHNERPGEARKEHTEPVTRIDFNDLFSEMITNGHHNERPSEVRKELTEPVTSTNGNDLPSLETLPNGHHNERPVEVRKEHTQPVTRITGNDPFPEKITNGHYNERPVEALSPMIGPPRPSKDTTDPPKGAVRIAVDGTGTVTIGTNGTPHSSNGDDMVIQSGNKMPSEQLKADQDGLSTFVDIGVAPLKMFTHWMEFRKLPQTTTQWCEITGAPTSTIEIVKLKTLVLAERLMVTELRRSVHDHLIDNYVGDAPKYELVILAFNNLPASTPLLQWMVLLYCTHWVPSMHDEKAMQLRPYVPREFLFRVMRRYAEFRVEFEDEVDEGMMEENYPDPFDYYYPNC